MKTLHVGGFNPIRRYKTLEAALLAAEDDDTIEIHTKCTFAGKVEKNIIIQGNGNIVSVESGTVGLDCLSNVVIRDIKFVTNPRANALILRKGGRLEQVTTEIKGPARVLYPTIIHKAGTLQLRNCHLMNVVTEAGTTTTVTDSVFTDYYGHAYHFDGMENLSVFSGVTTFTDCQINCCKFKAHSEIKRCKIGVFNHSVCDVKIYNSDIVPMESKPSVKLEKEPADGPMEHLNTESHFSWQHEHGTLTVSNFKSQIPNPFIGFHVLSGAIEIRNTNNIDDEGYHIIRNTSLTFKNVRDSAFYDTTNSTISKVRSEVETRTQTKPAMEKLNELIGLGNVKQQIRSILNTINMNQSSQNKNFDFSHHMIFAGDPGTGKTTVAKLVAQALFEIGAIPQNKCTEVSVDRLVKGYVGQTAEHVRNVLDEALGGVLFIDEAYELTVKENQNSFNSEVLSVLIRYMEEHRKDLVVIAAGYNKEMKTFLQSNVGLTRRFQWIQFEDYTPNEMTQIFESIRTSYNEQYEKDNMTDVLPKLFATLTSLYRRSPDQHGRTTNGGNGGLVRNVFQQIIQTRNDRIAQNPLTTRRISYADIRTGFQKEMEKAVQIPAM